MEDSSVDQPEHCLEQLSEHPKDASVEDLSVSAAVAPAGKPGGCWRGGGDTRDICDRDPDVLEPPLELSDSQG